MADLREVFEMTTKQMDPDPDSWRQQEDRQRRAIRNRRIGAFVVAAAVVLAAALLVLTQVGGNGREPAQQIKPSGTTTQPSFVGLGGAVLGGVTLAPDAWEANLSPDGQWIVYITRSIDVGFCGGCSEDNRSRLTVASVDGSRSLFLYYGSGSRASQPVWSPDGSRIAFVETGLRRRGSNIAVLHTPGGLLPEKGLVDFVDKTRLTSGPTQKSWPSWSPDGNSIIYNDAGATPLDGSGFSPTQELYRVAADGSGAPARITTNHVDDSQAVYSPDGRQIALFHDGGITIMNSDGTHMHAIPTHGGFSPRWSPDGSKIAFLTYNDAERFTLPDPSTGMNDSWPRLDVKVLTVATGDITDVGVSVASDVNAVSWTPDGRRLFVSRALNHAG